MCDMSNLATIEAQVVAVATLREVLCSQTMAPDRMVDAIYELVDDLLLAGAFPAVDAALTVDVADMTTQAQIALLSITVAARGRLRNRVAFAQRVREHLMAKGVVGVDVLLRGLE